MQNQQSFFASLQAVRAKDTFRKFIDSVLSKSAKIRTLVSDLVKNYPDDETAQKHQIRIQSTKGKRWLGNHWAKKLGHSTRRQLWSQVSEGIGGRSANLGYWVQHPGRLDGQWGARGFLSGVTWTKKNMSILALYYHQRPTLPVRCHCKTQVGQGGWKENETVDLYVPWPFFFSPQNMRHGSMNGNHFQKPFEPKIT